MIAGVSNVEIVDSVNSDTCHVIKSRVYRNHPVSSEASNAGTSNRCDLACAYYHFSNAIILRVSNKHIALPIDSDTFWIGYHSSCSIDIVSIVAIHTGTSDCCDLPGAYCYFSKAIVKGVRNINIAVFVNCNGQGSAQLGSCGIDVISIVASSTRTSNR